MGQTKMRAGRLVAAYVDDAMGRRVVLADGEGWLSRVLVVGMTRRELRETIAVLMQLAEELPP